MPNIQPLELLAGRPQFKAAAALTVDEHRTKAFSPIRFKAEGEDDGSGGKLGPGEFIALAAVFDNIDSYGDRIIKGAFTQTLQEWAASGDPIPVIWQHNWADPNAHIGYVLEARETDEGLLYKGKLDIDENPFALQVYKLMKGRRVKQQSFGFDVIDGRSVTEDGRDVFEITRVHLYEVGPCLVGVNQATDLLEIKSAPAGSTSSASASAAAATSGQAAAPSANDPASVPAGSTPSPSSASKGMSPASALLLVQELEIEGED